MNKSTIRALDKKMSRITRVVIDDDNLSKNTNNARALLRSAIDNCKKCVEMVKRGDTDYAIEFIELAKSKAQRSKRFCMAAKTPSSKVDAAISLLSRAKADEGLANIASRAAGFMAQLLSIIEHGNS